MTTTTARDEVLDALAPFAELPDWLAAPMQPGRLEASLLAHVPELASGRLQLVRCRADRLRAKEDQWLIRCRVWVAAGERTAYQEPDEVVLVGHLLPPGRPEPAPEAPLGDGFGQPGHSLYLPDLRLQLATEEADPGLPALEDLTVPERAAALIEEMLRGGRYPQARVSSVTPHVARYKPGSRCTIVYDVAYDGPTEGLPDPVVGKTHYGEKGAFAHQAMTALWNTHLSAGEDVVLAEPLGFRPEERVLLQGPVPEDQTLKVLATTAFETMDASLLDSLQTELRRTATALAALHTSGAVFDRTVTVRDWLDETAGVLDRLTLTVPGVSSWAAPLMEDLERTARDVPADPLVAAHHDFRPAQVLLGPGPVGFIDFDGACMAEPGLDLGRFRGKLRDIAVTALAEDPEGYRPDRLQDRLELVDDYCDLFLIEYRAHAPVTTARVDLWETIDLLTAMLHSWTKVRLHRVQPRLAILRHQLMTTH